MEPPRSLQQRVGKRRPGSGGRPPGPAPRTVDRTEGRRWPGTGGGGGAGGGGGYPPGSGPGAAAGERRLPPPLPPQSVGLGGGPGGPSGFPPRFPWGGRPPSSPAAGFLAAGGVFLPPGRAGAVGGVGGALNRGGVVSISFAVTATLVVALGVLTALSEELGGRGLLVPELVRSMSFHRAALISGGIWAAWHFPLIVFADYNAATPAW